ncbi:aminopeptidase P family N-terminal domain-containing protein [Streptomyces sp. AN091965]|uniref:aminopeptidase P family N-terminal domain-containing protein n=1 Tax=Streptomyces sp. AN091965 TaxID=2927803 RepID=UPI001F60ED9F|nr:aminopeptidase P family N-terminal domain-containing protein [Streptomyces sp. AN091965]MCI3928406.1 aminopeptidase P family N-terminal domain-containing protein [Streptomyces sp. AN091965]
MSEPEFPPEEHAQRLSAVRGGALDRLGLTAALVTAPEDVHHLCGLDHQGHFAVTGLVVPLHGRPVLVERAMEAPTAAARTHGVDHHGYGDPEDPAEALLAVLTQVAPPGHAVGHQAASPR